MTWSGSRLNLGWSEPEYCTCGRLALACAGCGVPIRDEEGFGLNSLGLLCPSCYVANAGRRGRQCNRCIDQIKKTWPGSRIGYGNEHPMKHSKVLDTCVDREILPFLEGFNQEVAPTWVSCQGVPALPTNHFQWAEQPYVGVSGAHQGAVLEWTERRSTEYSIKRVMILDQGSGPHRIDIRFGETPTSWRG